jgi:hypothetical protein
MYANNDIITIAIIFHIGLITNLIVFFKFNDLKKKSVGFVLIL